LVEKFQIKLVYIISALFIAVNSLFIINEFYWFTLLPAFLFILLLFFFALDKLILLIVFLTPLSINIENFDIGVGVALPTEPLLFGIMILFILKLVSQQKFDKKVLHHPISIAIIIYLAWMFFTSITSEIPSVSFKFLISHLWFITTFYFIGTQLFKNYKNIKRFIWLYVIALLIVIIYTTYNHSLYGFMEKPAHWVMSPFFNDHTAYGAILAMFIPIILGFVLNKNETRLVRTLSFFIFCILILAIILSFGRASWLSLGVALIVFLVLKLKINYKYILAVSVVSIGVLLYYQTEIIMKLEKNRQDSSSDLMEHVQSISNISSDASNLERINRWQSAFRMFEQRPIVGWGPGTYQFVYAPFQRAKEKTIISTNAGEKGNSHSEYIGPLAESGLLGLLTILCIIGAFIYTSVKVYKRETNAEVKLLVLVTFLGMVTYFVHGTMNNFLDTDKASVPFWGFMAMIVAMDVYHSSQKKKTPSNTEELL